MNRRNFIRKICGGIAMMASPGILSYCSGQSKMPNIVLINIDDLGWADLGYQGSKFYETPNIDQLSREGMVFTNAYAAAANCAPSRACLMTGKNTPRHGIYTVANSDRGKAKDRKLIPIKNLTTLDKKFQTIPNVLQSAGYKCCHAGKWHLSDNPCDYGFDVNIAGCHWGNPSPGGGYFSKWDFPNFTEGDEGEYLTDRIIDYTLKFVEDNKSIPFFLHYSPYIVHTPIQPKKGLQEKYKNKEKTESHSHPGYAAMVETMDKNVGRLLAHLKTLNLEEKTFLIFTSDNGGLYKITKQWPLRAGKGSYYEGGIREPLIIKWPGNIKPNSKCDNPVSNIDFFPTILDIANIKPKNNIDFDGVSLIPVLTESEELKKRPLFWHFPVYLQGGNAETGDVKFRTRPGSVVRYGNWKLHEYFEYNTLELYNLKDDIGERNNLTEARPDITEKLHNMLKKWRASTDAPVPTVLNPKYNPD